MSKLREFGRTLSAKEWAFTEAAFRSGITVADAAEVQGYGSFSSASFVPVYTIAPPVWPLPERIFDGDDDPKPAIGKGKPNEDTSMTDT
jgi:hypothetical protein